MRKRRQSHRMMRTLALPSWLKLRMSDDFRNAAERMVAMAQKANADSVSMSVALKGRPWKVTLQVKRIYDKKH